MQRRMRALLAAGTAGFPRRFPDGRPVFAFHGFALALALAVSAGTTSARAQGEEPLQPYQMVRSLQLVQDRIADGDHAALPMQKKLLELIDARLRQATEDVFEDKRNYRSALIYSMSGGNPVTLEVVRSRLNLEPADAALADGILAYLNGRTREAREAFATIDPMAQTQDLGAFVALVKGSLLSTDDTAGAVAMYDKARLLGTGTLVEEAALRRSIGLSTKLKDAKRFTAWSNQYVRRFLRSPYASQFADAFVNGVVALHASVDFPAIEEIIEDMHSDQRKVIYLRLARRAAIEGLADVAAFAAKHIEEGTPEVAGDDPRAVLYASLSDVRSGNVDDVIVKLRGIDRARLSERDRELLDAVLSVASQVTAPIEPAAVSPAEPSEAEGDVVKAGELSEAEEAARAEGPLPEMVPEDEPAEPAKEPAATAPAEHVEEPAAPSHDEPVEASADAGHAPVEPVAKDGVTDPPADETTTAATQMAADARQKLDAIDKLLEENADK